MSSRFLPTILVAGAALLAVAAGTQDFLRRGNAAFDAGDYLTALDYYTQAEAESLDPGQVAFAKAAAYYQLAATVRADENYQLANVHYRRCLEDATGPRRVKALYGLGNTLAQQGHRRRGSEAVAMLQAALDSYAEAGRAFDHLPEAEKETLRPILAWAARNASVIEPILAQRKQELAANPSRQNGGETEPPKEHRPPPGIPEAPKPANGRRDPNRPGPPPAWMDRPIETSETRPGKGNLPPLKSDDDIAELDPERAREYLEERLQQVRVHIANRQPAIFVKDKLPRDY